MRIGVQSYSFRTLPLDAAIKAVMSDIGIGECELYSGHVEPRPSFGGPRPKPATSDTKADSAKPGGGTARKGQEDLRNWALDHPDGPLHGHSSQIR